MASIIPRCRPPTSPRKPPTPPKRAFTASARKLIRALDYTTQASSSAIQVSTDTDNLGGLVVSTTSSKTGSLSLQKHIQQRRRRSLNQPVSFHAMSDATLAVNNQTNPSSKGSHGNTQGNGTLDKVAQSSKENGFGEVDHSEHNKTPLPQYSYKNYKPSPARVYVWHVDEADDLVDCLQGPVGFDLEWRVIFRRNTPMRPAATVQLSDKRMILVIQITAMSHFPKKLKALLENPNIPKVGVNILNDGNKLARDYNVRPQNLVELGGLARQADPNYIERYFKYAEPPSGSKANTRVKARKRQESKEDARTGTKEDAKEKVVETASAPLEVPEPTVKLRKPGFMISLATITAMYTGCALPKGPVRSSNWEVIPLSEQQLEYAANDAHCALMVYNTLHEMAEASQIKLVPEKYTQNVQSGYGSAKVTHAIPVKKASSAKGRIEKADSSLQEGSSHVQRSLSAPNLLDKAEEEEEEEGESSSFELVDPLKPYQKESNKSTGTADKDLTPVLNARNTSPRKTLPLSSSSRPRSSIPPQHMRAYKAWTKVQVQSQVTIESDEKGVAINNENEDEHQQRILSSALDDICAQLRSREAPLKRTTVISYVVRALQADTTLPYSHAQLGALLRLESASWKYFGTWYGTLSKRNDSEPGGEDREGR